MVDEAVVTRALQAQIKALDKNLQAVEAQANQSQAEFDREKALADERLKAIAARWTKANELRGRLVKEREALLRQLGGGSIA